MSIDDLRKFQAASEAAEGWLSTVSLVAQLGRTGSVDPAFKLLMPTASTKSGRPYNLQDSYSAHAEVLDQMRDRLAALSDSPVTWEHGRGLSGMARVPGAVYPHVWSSAHEAAAGIARLTLALLAKPVAEITDPTEQWTVAQQLLARYWKVLTIPLDERAALCERIRRERAKFLAQATSSCSMLESSNSATSEQLPAAGSKFTEKHAPAEFRQGGKPKGKVLTAPYLAESTKWRLKGSYLTKHFGPDKELKHRIKVGSAYAYCYEELLILRDRRDTMAEEREKTF